MFRKISTETFYLHISKLFRIFAPEFRKTTNH